MPKGYKTRKTIEKEQAREVMRQIIIAEMHEMLDAQIKNAIGIRHLLMRDAPTGKLRRFGSDAKDSELTREQIDEAIQTGEAVWIYTKDPSVQAFTYLMNQALGKPARQTTVTGKEEKQAVIFKWQDAE